MVIVLMLIGFAARIASAAPADDPELDPEELEELVESAFAAELASELEAPEDPEGVDLEVMPELIDDHETAEPARRSPIGRVDLSLVWRRIEPPVSAQRDEVWLLGTWRL